MFDIITFGAAAQDIHLKSKAFKLLGNDVCLPLGSKIEVEDVFFASGGGGTNVAVTFAKQGFKTAFCGAVGNDVSGDEIIKELKGLKVDTSLVFKKTEKHTNQSIVISTAGDRTILIYRGASDLFSKNDIPWKKLKAKWFYLAPLSGLLCDSFEKIVDFAVDNKIKVAVNPSQQQLEMDFEFLKRILSKVDVLFLNQNEADLLAGKKCLGVNVITKGGEGVLVSDEEYLYFAKPNPDRKVVDTTGAGDSFASGFLAGYIKAEGDIEKAIQLGMANSEANLTELGAKTGLLEKNAKFQGVPVTKTLK